MTYQSSCISPLRVLSAVEIEMVTGGNYSAMEAGDGGGGGGSGVTIDLGIKLDITESWNKLIAWFTSASDEQKVHNSFNPFAAGSETSSNGWAKDAAGNRYHDHDGNGLYDERYSKGADGDWQRTTDNSVWKRFMFDASGEATAVTVEG